MSNHAINVINRNLVLKKVGDLLYLPCVKQISCKVTPNLPRLPYYMCRSVGLDESSGRLLLDYPRLEKYNEEAYAISIQVNSNIILASNIKEFEILGSTRNSIIVPHKYEPKDFIGIDESKLMTPKFESANINRPVKAYVPAQSERTILDEKKAIPVIEMVFGEGKATFTYFVNTLLGTVTFEIMNPAIKKEYDAVKEYFPKVGIKNIECQIKLLAIARDIQSLSAHFCNPDIINADLFVKVEDYVINSMFFDGEGDISILEDKLANTTTKLGGKGPKDSKSLLDELQKRKKSKHYYHLRYLSSKQEEAWFKLRITDKPVSFIFVIKGDVDYFLVWETYETEEATYVWKLASSNKQSHIEEVKKLLDKIAWLRGRNKIQYIRSKPPNFCRIEHEYVGDDWGFEKWKAILTQKTTRYYWEKNHNDEGLMEQS